MTEGDNRRPLTHTLTSKSSQQDPSSPEALQAAQRSRFVRALPVKASVSLACGSQSSWLDPGHKVGQEALRHSKGTLTLEAYPNSLALLERHLADKIVRSIKPGEERGKLSPNCLTLYRVHLVKQLSLGRTLEKVQHIQGSPPAVRQYARERGGSGGRTRTCDQAVNSRSLYRLSYAGTKNTRSEGT